MLLCVSVLLSACAATRAPDCNLYVISLMKEKNIYLPQKNANGLNQYLQNSPQWTTLPRADGKLDHAAAYEAAKKGRAVLAAYDTGSGRSGHIAAVYGKKKPAWSAGFAALVPYVKGKVNGRSPQISLLSAQFSPSKEKKISYYIYNK